MTRDTDASFEAAFDHHQGGRLDAARSGYHDTLAMDPAHADSLHLLGLLISDQGDARAGVVLIERAIALAPGRAPHHNSLALAYRALGRSVEAIREFTTAAALRPESAEIHNNLATALRASGLRDEAVAEYRRAASLAPETAEIWYNLASTLADDAAGADDAGLADVEPCFRRALGLRPDYVDALANFARWLMGRCRWAEAEALLADAVRLEPGDARNWNNLGIARQEQGRIEAAEACYRRAVAQAPNYADGYYNLGCLLAGDGRGGEAVACHEAAIAADPLHGAARLAACMARLPILYRDEAEVADRRADYLASLNSLAAAVETAEIAGAVAAAIGTSQPFFLPYQGENDREPQAEFGRIACRLLAKQPPPRPRTNTRIRLGIVSGFFHDHTIFRLFLEGWLTELDRGRFEVIGIHTGRTRDADTARAAALCDSFIQGLPSAGAWSKAVADLAADVLLYPEVGIDPICGRLAAQRLAPVQCVAWGHPETTGMATLDHFLSADLMEPPEGDDHYTEHLIRLPGLGLHYTPAVPAGSQASPERDPDVPVYWSGQALYKYLPRYDAIFPRIAAAVGPCRFVFIAFAKSAAVTAAFNARLSRAFAAFGLDAERYCVMLPAMSQDRFIAAVGNTDVILDTLGWSGGKSSLDCLVHDPAIVTMPGRFMRGRHTAAILRQIGCEATVAASIDEYVAIAARLGLDAGFRTRVRQSVAAGKHRAFRDTAPVRALETLLREAVA